MSISDRELAENASFLVWLKTASYAPPDVTGELEGRFAAPLESVVEAISSLIENEMKTGYAYRYYANNLRDFAHHSIAEEFEEHADHETEHAEFLMRRLAVLVGAVQLPDIPAPPPVSSPEEVIQTMVRVEQEGIAKWRLLRSLIGDENPMRFKIEEYMTREQEHLDQLWQLLPRTPEVKQASEEISFDAMTRRAATRKPTREHLNAVTNPDAPEGGNVRFVSPTTMEIEEGKGSLTQKEVHDRIDSLLTAEAASKVPRYALLGGATGAFAGRKLGPSINAGVDQLRDYIARKRAPNGMTVVTMPGGRDYTRAATYGLGALGALGSAAIPAISMKMDKKKYDELRDEYAPPIEGGAVRVQMPEESNAGYGRRILGLAGMSLGHSAMGDPKKPGPELMIAGGALLADGALKGLESASIGSRKMLEQMHHARAAHAKGRADESARAASAASIPPVEVPSAEKAAAMGFPMPAIPSMLTPSQSAADSNYRPDGSPSPSALRPPVETFPEQLDPRLISELQNEEAARVQESEAASAYFQGQLQQQKMESEQLQQQLQQMQEQLEQAGQQLEQVSAEKEQVQQMAQQASDTATGALQSQLQAQQDALQSRATAAQALTFTDELRQRVRELVDPPPAPPPPMGGPAAPVGQDPNAPAPPPSPAAPEADPNAPKTASSLGGASRVLSEDLSAKGLMLNVGLPLATAAASAALTYRHNTQHGQEMLEKARQATAKAKELHDENPSYRNAASLMQAKTKEMAVDLGVRYPKNVALATGGSVAGITRGTIEALSRIGAHLRDMSSVRANSKV